MKTEYNYEDQSLLLAIKNGNEKAFDTLFRKYYPMLCAYGNKFVELEDAEECVQDAMLWLWENKDMLVIQSSLSNYLFSIVHHRAINRIKQQEVKSRVENYFYEEMHYESFFIGFRKCFYCFLDTYSQFFYKIKISVIY